MPRALISRWSAILALALAAGCSDSQAPSPAGPDTSDADSADLGPAPTCTSAAQCDDKDPCNGVETCDATAGCQPGAPVAGCCTSNVKCDDGLACNGIETCDLKKLACQPGKALACDDAEPCNGVESCIEGVGCAPGTALDCDDADLCNGQETCAPEVGCQPGTALACDDADACNGLETCDAALGCVTGAKLACDDGDPCNGKETCDAAAGCVAGAPLACDDGNPCNGAEICEQATGCGPGVPLKCDDGDVCNGFEGCDPQSGCVLGSPVSCDDLVACNGVETCDPKLGCQPGTSPLCDDGNACNGAETCDDKGGCQAGLAPDCDDADACDGVETCDPKLGCQAGAALACDDGDACNGKEGCSPAGGCTAGVALACDDGLPCNGVEVCDKASGCVAGAPPLGCCTASADCDDGKACNGEEACDAGSKTCVLGSALSCSDGDACNGAEECVDPGGCVAAAAPDCDDQNPCTADGCEPAVGCTHAPATATCDDGDACTTGDSCAGGSCQPGSLKKCGDGDPCNGFEACDAALGCVPGAALVCDDANVCNGVEACTPGKGCVAGAPLACGDGSPCTLDSCDPAAGCVHSPTSAPCDDGDACTTGDTCADSACQAGAAASCDDGDPCSFDSCQKAVGCVHEADTAPPVIAITGVPLVSKSAVTPVVAVAGPSIGALTATLDGQPYVPGTPVATPGTHTLVATAIDCQQLPQKATATFTIDVAPPALTAKLAPKPNAAGWNNTPVTVSFKAEDTVSVTPSVTVSAQGAGEVVTGTATDAAGNTASVSITVKTDFKSPSVTITAPVVNADGNDQYVTGADSVVFTGTLGQDELSGFAEGRVTSSKHPVDTVLDGAGPFQVAVPLALGVNTVIVSGRDKAGNTGTASVCVIRDGEPPVAAIQYPTDGFATADESVSVSGFAHDVVVGAITNEDVAVTVNGVTATVQNGHFTGLNIPLALGDNTITAVATDAVGHTTSHTIHVLRAPPAGKRLAIAGGDQQTGKVLTALPTPLAVTLSLADGAPVAGADVLFAVTDNDGTLSHPGAKAVSESGRELLTTTDAQGRAEALLTLGERSGAGQNRVTVTAADVVGSVSLFATGEPLVAMNLYPHGGQNQNGTTNQPLPMPLAVLVTDVAQNPVGGVPVTFTVIDGDGKFPGGKSTIAISNLKGFADVPFTPGELEGASVHAVRATIDQPGDGTSQTELGVTFYASAYAPRLPEFTAVRGQVLDDDQQPVQGVTLRFPNTDPLVEGVTDQTGRFYLTRAPAGFALLEIDGQTAGPQFPHMVFEVNNVEGQDNTLDRPIYLPTLNQGAFVDGSETVALTLAELPGFQLTIPAGTTVTFPDGSHEGIVSLTQVNFDQAPMPPVNGLQSRVLVTIQPPGVRFDPPAPLQIPNVDGYPPGRKVEMYSFDHDLQAFVTIGPGSVSSDGTVVRSDPGVGVLEGGWHCGGNPEGSGSSGNITASISRAGGKDTTIKVIGSGGPAEGTSWSFCSSGSLSVSGGCGAVSECPATVTPTNGNTGHGKVRTVHTCTETGESAQATTTITICDTPAVKDKWEFNLGKDAFQTMVDRTNSVLSILGCTNQASDDGGPGSEGSLSFNVEGEKYKTCCLGCPGVEAENGQIFASAKAKIEADCDTPWGKTVTFGPVSVSMGLKIFIEGNVKAGFTYSTDGCAAPPDNYEIAGGAAAELKIGGRLYLAKVVVGKWTVVDVHGDIYSGVSGSAELSAKHLYGKICWSGIVVEAVASVLNGTITLYKKEIVLFCPKVLLEGELPFSAPEPAGGAGCANGPEEPGEPPCGKQEGDAGPDGGPDGDPNTNDGGGNTGYSGDCGNCPGVTPGDPPPCTSHAECTDHDQCNGIETCDPAAGCQDADPLECGDDGVECTEDKCDPSEGCVHELHDEQCDDGTACTEDKCTGSGCTHAPHDDRCDDSLSCSVDSCDPAAGCNHDYDDALCNDSIACTEDQCLPSGCQHEAVDAECDDGVACTDDSCAAGVGCKNLPQNAECDDGVACTKDSCSASAGCQNVPDDAACDDGAACTSDACQSGSGCDNTPHDEQCNDGVACTDDACQGSLGCAHEPNEQACDDGVSCTSDYCLVGQGCVHDAHDDLCADGVACTADTCAGGCQHAPQDALCQDGAACTIDTCTASGCATTINAAACDDGVACTTDACLAFTGCWHQPNAGACSDGVACTKDACTPAGCTHAPIHADCDDQVGCTADACHPQDDCRHVPNAAACADNVACTKDICDPQAGCAHVAQAGVCDDGDLCTLDSCTQVGCQHAAIPSCVPTGGCQDCPGACARCGHAFCQGGQVVRYTPSGATCQLTPEPCGPSETTCQGDALATFTCQGGGCAPVLTPCPAGQRCFQPKDGAAQCVACCAEGDCPRSGLPFCDAGTLKDFSCTNHECAPATAACPESEIGPASCNGKDAVYYVCGASSCAEELLESCQTCQAGACVGAEP